MGVVRLHFDYGHRVQQGAVSTNPQVSAIPLREIVDDPCRNADPLPATLAGPRREPRRRARYPAGAHVARRVRTLPRRRARYLTGARLTQQVRGLQDAHLRCFLRTAPVSRAPPAFPAPISCAPPVFPAHRRCCPRGYRALLPSLLRTTGASRADFVRSSRVSCAPPRHAAHLRSFLRRFRARLPCFLRSAVAGRAPPALPAPISTEQVSGGGDEVSDAGEASGSFFVYRGATEQATGGEPTAVPATDRELTLTRHPYRGIGVR